MDGIDVTPKAVFFDWDGTLVDTLNWLLSAHNHVRAVLGYEPWSVGEFKGHVKYSSRELYGSLYGEKKQEALDILAKFMEENHLENLEILPDSYELLAFLKEQGRQVGIVSNKRHPFLLREIEHLGWGHMVDIAIGAGHVEKDKPAPDPLLAALAACDLAAGKDIWYVGDSETDMITARDAGCSAILVRHHHDNEHLVAAYSPAGVFDDNAGLQKALSNMW